MALSWDTYRAIPRLFSYTDAKRWHDDTTPIRGDENKTRPCGRRDQKWFSIWERKDAIHVGYGARPIDQCHALVSYERSGSIIVSPYHYGGASTNERLTKLLGAKFQTYQYDTWVHCDYYDNGERKTGWLPIPRDRPARFMMEGESLVFVNYAYPVIHKINKDKMNETAGKYAEFLTYVKGVWKLAGGRPFFEMETRAEAFGTYINQFNKTPTPNSPPNLRWGKDKDEARVQFFEWAASSDPMDHLRATITLNWVGNGENPIETFKEYVVRTYKERVLDKVEHREGKLVKDRLKLWLLD